MLIKEVSLGAECFIDGWFHHHSSLGSFAYPSCEGTCAAMLILMAGLTALTGVRTPIVLKKICPFVKGVIAGLFIVASIL